MGRPIEWPPPAEFVDTARQLLVFLREREIRFVDDQDADLSFGYWRDSYFFTLYRNGLDVYIEIEAPLVVALKVWKGTIGQLDPNHNDVRLYGRIREPGILYSLVVNGKSWHMTRRDIESYAG